MTETYSTYEAKAKLSEILRKVESGRTIRISRRGQPIAEIRPVSNEPATLERRIAELSEQGALTAPARRSRRPEAASPSARRASSISCGPRSMRVGYVDTSCLVAVAFAETGHEAVVARLDGLDRLVASNLLEAELQAALRRENVPDHGSLTARLSWVLPDRPLSAEIRLALLKLGKSVELTRGTWLAPCSCRRNLASSSSSRWTDVRLTSRARSASAGGGAIDA